jgi:hypothetical protein
VEVVIEFCRWLGVLKIIDNKLCLVASFFFTVMFPDLFCEASPTHIWGVITSHINISCIITNQKRGSSYQGLLAKLISIGPKGGLSLIAYLKASTA